jgi:hypothetical protein
VAAVEIDRTDHRLADVAKHALAQFLAGPGTERTDLDGFGQAELLADTLSLLFEGARVSVQTVGTEGPSAQFVRMAEGLIASFRAR